MQRSFIFLMLLLVAVFAKVLTLKLSQQPQKSSPQKFNIAVLTKNAPFYREVCQGLEEAIKRRNKADIFELRYFYGEGMNKTLSKAMIEEAIGSQPDAIVSIGVTFSQLAGMGLKKRNSSIPLIFAGPGNPKGLGIIKNLEQPEENITGVALTPASHLQAARLLLLLKPNASHILIPYNPLASCGILEPIVDQLTSFFKSYGKKTTVLPLNTVGEVLSKISAFINVVDVIMCLEGDFIGEAESGLIKLCSQHQISLFAKDLGCIKNGAAFGFGTSPETIGNKAYCYLKKILENKVAIKDLPVQWVDYARKIGVNLTAAKKQNLRVPEDILLCLSRGVVYE